MKTANETTTLTPVETSRKMREHRWPQLTPDFPWENPTQIERPAFLLRKRRSEHLDQIPASRLATRLKLLRKTLRPTPHVQLAMKGMASAAVAMTERLTNCRRVRQRGFIMRIGSDAYIYC